MADGSVIIGVALDSAAFEASAAALESQITAMAARINQSLSAALSYDPGIGGTGAIMSGIVESITASSVQIELAVSELAGSAAAAFQAAPWHSAGYGAIAQIGSGMTSGASVVMGAAQSAAAMAAEAFSGGGWSSIGSNMMAGIASGIYSAGASVVAAINAVAREAEEAVKKYYEISSPSGLMRDEVGVMISRGIAEGILDGGSYVRSALETVYSDIPRRGADGMSRTDSAVERRVVQNIYLRDTDQSPYRTAKRIRRESEALFR